jgi:antitoxin component of MazEF toxin-antitoxin module
MAVRPKKAVRREKKRAVKRRVHYRREKPLRVAESEGSYRAYTRIRAIGNSKGVILSNQVIEAARINPEIDVLVMAKEGMIMIVEAKSSTVNTNLSSWDDQFKNAIKGLKKPEKDMFRGMENEFDQSEW